MYEKQVHVFGKTGAPISQNRCMYLGKQVHPFWKSVLSNIEGLKRHRTRFGSEYWVKRKRL